MTEEKAVKKATAPRAGRPTRAEIEADVRAKLEAEIREQILAEKAIEEERERQIREAASEAKPITATVVDGDPEAQNAVTIHFVDDGFTSLGKVWYRGETLTVVPGTKQWDESQVTVRKGSTEKMCFALLDEDQQVAKWGRRFFRPGVWKGSRLDQVSLDYLVIKDPVTGDPDWDATAKARGQTKEQLIKAQRLHEERYGPVTV